MKLTNNYQQPQQLQFTKGNFTPNLTPSIGPNTYRSTSPIHNAYSPHFPSQQYYNQQHQQQQQQYQFQQTTPAFPPRTNSM